MNWLKTMLRRIAVTYVLFSVFIAGMWFNDVISDVHVVQPAMAGPPTEITRIEHRVPDGMIAVDRETWEAAERIIEARFLPVRGAIRPSERK